MKIVLAPQSVLTSPSQPVETITPKIQKLVSDMIDTLIAQKDPEGVGLAAPQVGVSARIFIMRPSKKAVITVCINPEFVNQEVTLSEARTKKKKTKKEEHAQLEGCLSIPRIWGAVDRQPTVEIKYLTLSGEMVQKRFEGFEATIVQHEMDHLDGKLFTSRVLEQKNSLYKEINGELEKYEI